MATVTLDQVRIHLASDYSTSVALDVGALREKSGGYTSVQRFAGGRRVAINQAGTRASFSITADLPARTVVDFVRGLGDGDEIVVRDPLGRVIFGVVAGDVTIDESAGASTTTRATRVSFDIDEITDDPEV